MDVDINTLRGLSTLLALIAFIAVCIWAYSRRRKQDFEQAADLPFADEQQDSPPAQAESTASSERFTQ